MEIIDVALALYAVARSIVIELLVHDLLQIEPKIVSFKINFNSKFTPVISLDNT